MSELQEKFLYPLYVSHGKPFLSLALSSPLDTWDIIFSSLAIH
jgi:hypothetical protein